MAINIGRLRVSPQVTNLTDPIIMKSIYFNALQAVLISGLTLGEVLAQGDIYCTTTYELKDKGSTLKIEKEANGQTATTEIQYGNGDDGVPGLPHIVTHADSTECKYTYEPSEDGYQITIENGLFTGSSLQTGNRSEWSYNDQGFPVSEMNFQVIGSSSVLVAGSTYTNFTTWNAPESCEDEITGLEREWEYEGARSRLSSSRTGLGVSSSYDDYDVLERLTEFEWDNSSGSHRYNSGGGFGVSSQWQGSAGRNLSSLSSVDALGRPLSVAQTAGDRTTSATYSHSNTDSTITSNDGVTGADRTTVVRQDDGTVDNTHGNTQAFGGSQQLPLSVTNGVFESKTMVADQNKIFETTRTDGYSRLVAIEAPSTATGDQSGDTDETTFVYNDFGTSMRRVVSTDAAGRVHIVESDATPSSGAPYLREGYDINKNGTLDAGDRYTEQITAVQSGSIVTTTKLNEDNGFREVLKQAWTPQTNTTVTTINEHEETITEVIDYNSQTVTTTSTRGWESVANFDKLGLTSEQELSGVGIRSHRVTPTYRQDGSVKGIDSLSGGVPSGIEFNDDDTLSSVRVPIKGEILETHSYSSGSQILQLNGVQSTTSLDGTLRELTGDDVIPHRNETSVDGNGINFTYDPDAGAQTVIKHNNAGVKTTHDYPSGADYQSEWQSGGLQSSYTNGRGARFDYTYANNGAQDLERIFYDSSDIDVSDTP